MKLQDFRDSLTSSEPPSKLSRVLMALWWDAKQDWTRAHECAQQEETSEGAWVHAYLHRKEGDQNNAAYWYSRAGKPVCREPLETEWLQIAQELLK
jgi:tRNA G37 N-methylase Trm5